MLDATPERVACARRAETGAWTFGPEGAVEITTNSVLADMVTNGLVEPRFVSAHQQVAGREDYYRLTEAGEKWLAEHEENP